MLGFVLAAAVLIAATLLLLLQPWRKRTRASAVSAREVNTGIYRDQLAELDRDLAAGTISQPDHAQARAELQRRLLDDAQAGDATADTTRGMGKTALLLVLALPLAAGGLYTWLGQPGALDPAATRVVTQEDVERMIAEVAARMEKNPEDTGGWIVLARSYRAMGRLPQAEAAFERIGDPLYQSPVLMAEYADVLATRAMGNFEGKPGELVARALALDPHNGMALSLAATQAYNGGDLPQAITYWEQLLKLVPPGSEDAQWVQEALAKTREMTASAPATAPVKPPPTPAPAAPPAAAAATSITGQVTLAPELAARVQPTDTVFVFARSPQGSRMPLAILRTTASALPLSFTLDDSHAMAPSAVLSGASEVVVEARISRSGQAAPSSGDLFGRSIAIRPGTRDLALQIDQIQP